jgi:hypothetical protein
MRPPWRVMTVVRPGGQPLFFQVYLIIRLAFHLFHSANHSDEACSVGCDANPDKVFEPKVVGDVGTDDPPDVPAPSINMLFDLPTE